MNVVDVATGEIKYAGKKHILISHAIGSCIVITVYDPQKQFAGMAHIMLPGKAPVSRKDTQYRYAQNAIDAILGRMTENHAKIEYLQVCLVGAGNVLKKDDDLICQHNINSVKNILKSYNISVKAESLGGFERRTMKLIVETGEVFYSTGSSAEKSLYDPNTNLRK